MRRLDNKAVWLFFLIYGQGILAAALVLIVFSFYAYLPVATPENGASLFQLSMKSGIAEAVKVAWVMWILALVGCYLWAYLTCYFYRYELAEEEFRQEQGIIFKRFVSIPYNQIQNIDVYRGIWERFLGLSDLRIETAGRSGNMRDAVSPEGRLIGVSKEEADALRQELIQRAHSIPQPVIIKQQN